LSHSKGWERVAEVTVVEGVWRLKGLGERRGRNPHAVFFFARSFLLTFYYQYIHY